MQNIVNKHCRHALYVVLYIVLYSCSIHYSLTDSQIPKEAETFSIQTFKNTATQTIPGFELKITEALRDIIQSQTKLKLVNTIDADYIIEGDITTFITAEPVNLQSNDVSSQNQMKVRVNIRLVNNIETAHSFEQVFEGVEIYSSQTDFFTIEEELSDRIIEQIGQSIFFKIFSNW